MKTIKIKLKPTKAQAIELTRLSREYIRCANELVRQAIQEEAFPKVTSKNIDGMLPSSVKNELIRYAKTKYKQFGHCVFKKPMASWNNQNFSVDKKSISFPIIINGKSKKYHLKHLFLILSMKN